MKRLIKPKPVRIINKNGCDFKCTDMKICNSFRGDTLDQINGGCFGTSVSNAHHIRTGSVSCAGTVHIITGLPMLCEFRFSCLTVYHFLLSMAELEGQFPLGLFACYWSFFLEKKYPPARI